MPGKYTAAALLLVILGSWRFFFAMTPDDASRRMYPEEAFAEERQVGDYLKDHTVAGDKIAVIGSEPEILFYSGRRSATGYIYAYTLMESGPLVKQMQQDMIRQIEDAHPEYMVFVKLGNSWGKTDKSERLIFDWAEKYCPSNYDIVGRVDWTPGKPGTFYWGKDAAAATPLPQQCIYVLKRKAPTPMNGGAK